MKKIWLSIILTLSLAGTRMSLAQNLTELDYLRNISRTGSPEWEREDIKGTPFLFEDWYPAEIITKDDRKLEVAQLNYNAKQQKFYYKQQGEYYELFPTQIRLIRVIGPEGVRTFVPTLPKPVAGKRKFAFYEIFEAPEKAYVAMAYYKILEPADKSQSYASDKSMRVMKYYAKKRVFVLVNGYFVRRPSSLNKLLKLLHASDDLRRKVKQFYRKERLSYSSPVHLQRILAYYYDRKSFTK